MIRAQDVIGLPVIEIRKGKKLGKCRDLLIDGKGNVAGLLLESKRWFQRQKYIPTQAVTSFGEESLTVADADVIERLESSTGFTTLTSGRHRIKDMPVTTETGQPLGVVTDVYFANQSGNKIIGYELSDGFIADLKAGRKWMPVSEPPFMGDDALVLGGCGSDDLQEADQINE